MPKKNSECCVIFRDFEGNVRGLFSTKHLINCFDEADKQKYIDVINNPKMKEVLSDEELYSTITSFLKNDLNIAKTSKESYMHRNTLIYRLDKVEKLTGLNLKKFEDAALFVNLITVKEYLLKD